MDADYAYQSMNASAAIRTIWRTFSLFSSNTLFLLSVTT